MFVFPAEMTKSVIVATYQRPLLSLARAAADLAQIIAMQYGPITVWEMIQRKKKTWSTIHGSGIETAIKANYFQFFRWHVSGEIIDSDYFARMVAIAEHCQNTRFLAFTKKYSAVNDFIAAGGTIPANLKVIFSAAPDLEMVNPYNLPEAHVDFVDASKNTCKKPESMKYHCPGNCAKCRFCGAGCWFLENGAAVVFDQH